jgi:hypothetical protein
MTPIKEKGRRMGDPIPKIVLADDAEFTASLIKYQAQHLAATFGMMPDTASTVATLAFYGALRT